MKGIKSFVSIIMISMLFNLSGSTGPDLARVFVPVYWMATVGLVVLLIIGVLLIQNRLMSLANYWEKKYPRCGLVDEKKFHFKKLPFSAKISNIGSTVFMLMFIYLFILFMFSYVQPTDTATLFLQYLKFYGLGMAVICTIYTSYVFHKGRLPWMRFATTTLFVHQREDTSLKQQLLRKNTVIREINVHVNTVVTKETKIVPPHVLDEYIVIGSLFHVLFHVNGLGPFFNAAEEVRMFDVPFYYSSASTKEVILINGERRKTDRFMKELEKRGLDKWYFKINNNYSINMMLIYYPVSQATDRLVLHREVFDSLRQHLSELDIQKVLVLSIWIKKQKKLVAFLDNINNLRHTGWDDYIPLSTKSSQL